MADVNRTIDRSIRISRSVADLLQRRLRAAGERYASRVGAAQQAWREAVAGHIENAAAAEGRTLPLPGERMATAILALGNGLALEAMLGDDQSDLVEVVARGLA